MKNQILNLILPLTIGLAIIVSSCTIAEADIDPGVSFSITYGELRSEGDSITPSTNDNPGGDCSFFENDVLKYSLINENRVDTAPAHVNPEIDQNGKVSSKAGTTPGIYAVKISTDESSSCSLKLIVTVTPTDKAALNAAIENGIKYYGNQADFSYIKTENIKDMSELFQDNSNFKGDISSWMVNNVTNMSSMFAGATAFNGEISGWTVSNVTNMSSMFAGATDFNKDISNWNVSNVTDMSYMFAGASAFNRDISNWHVAEGVDKLDMFEGTVLDKDTNYPYWYTPPTDDIILSYSISKVSLESITDQGFTLTPTLGNSEECELKNEVERDKVAFTINPLSEGTPGTLSAPTIDNKGVITLVKDSTSPGIYKVTSEVTGKSDCSTNVTITLYVTPDTKGKLEGYLTTGISHFGNTADFSYIHTENIKDMSGLFQDNSAFKGDISSWNVSKVTNMSRMFKGATAFNRDISGWTVSKVSNMSHMFEDATDFNQDLENWKVVGGVYKVGMFNGTGLATSGKYPTWYTPPTDKIILSYANSKVSLESITDQGLTLTPTLGNSEECALKDEAANRRATFAIKPLSVGTPNTLSDPVIEEKTGVITLKDSTSPGIYQVTVTVPENSACDTEVTITLYVTPTNKSDLQKHVGNGISHFGDGADFSYIHTENIKDMSGLFQDNSAFKGDISSWNVSKVTNMSRMFKGATAFNRDISGWTVSKVTNMSHMFEDATDFNQDLENWKVVGGVYKVGMFNGTGLATSGKYPTWYLPPTDKIILSYSNSKVSLSTTKLYPTLGNSKQCELRNEADGGRATFTITPLVNNAPEIDNKGVITLEESTSPGIYKVASEVTGKSDCSTNVTITLQVAPDTKDELQRYVNNGISHFGNTADFSYINTENIKDMSGLFQDTAFKGNISNWKVGNVIDMSSMFAGASNFNGDISGWKVGNVTDMSSMFAGASNFNGNISGWNVGSVANMNDMFRGASNFNGDISSWDEHVQATTVALRTFNGSRLQDDPPEWWLKLGSSGPALGYTNLASERATSGGSAVFTDPILDDIQGCKLLTLTDQGKIEYEIKSTGTTTNPIGLVLPEINPKTGRIFITNKTSPGVYEIKTTTSDSKYSCDTTTIIYITITLEDDGENRIYSEWGLKNSFRNTIYEGIQRFGNEGNFNYILTGKLTSFNRLFGDYAFELKDFNGKIDEWDTSSVESMTGAFSFATNFNQDISRWNVGNVTTMLSMFGGAPKFNQPIGNWNVSKVEDMRSMFHGATSFNQPLSNWNVSNVTNMESMFQMASNFSQDISDWELWSIKNMDDMFDEARRFGLIYDSEGNWIGKFLDLDDWNAYRKANNLNFVNNIFLNSGYYYPNYGAGSKDTSPYVPCWSPEANEENDGQNCDRDKPDFYY